MSLIKSVSLLKWGKGPKSCSTLFCTALPCPAPFHPSSPATHQPCLLLTLPVLCRHTQPCLAQNYPTLPCLLLALVFVRVAARSWRALATASSYCTYLRAGWAGQAAQ